jgi:hypothetical protein
MTLLDRHPDAAALTRATDDALMVGVDDAVRTHVAACASCADEVTAARALGLRVRAMTLAAPPERMVARALARRRAGERVLLPLEDGDATSAVTRTRSPRLGSRVALAAASLAIVSVGAWALLSPRGLDAAPPAERLRVVSGRAQPGQTVDVEYAALPALAGRESLVVRAFSRADNAALPVRWHEPLVVLRRDAARRFRGTFTWPAAAIVTAAVESADGVIVDANNGDLVDLLATDAAGNATFEALVSSVMRGDEHFGSLGGGPDASALQARVAELERRFPNQPESWALSAVHAHSPTVWDAWFGAFARRTRALERLDRELASASGLPARSRRAMLALARSQEEPEVAAEWAQRVGGDSVVDPVELEQRTVADIMRRRDAAAARAFLRDSLRSPIDYFLAVQFGTFDRLGAAGDHAPLVPCPELQAAFTRAHNTGPAPRRPLGVTVAAFTAWRDHLWARQQQLVSQCGVPYPERLARYNAWARTATPYDWSALRAMGRSPRER